MIHTGINNIQSVKDVFTEFDKLEGELSDELAKATLAEFLYHNPSFLMDILGGIKMFPMQELILKGWARNDYNLGVWGRGIGKTLAYNRTSQLLSRDHGLIALPDLLPNVDFSKEGWVDIDPLYLWNGDGWQRTDKIYVQPQKNCLRVTTREGYALEGSTNHLIKIWNPETLQAEWRKYDQIKVGDLACISRTDTNWGDPQPQSELDEAYLVGLLIGDGCYARKEYGCRITSADEQILQFIEQRWPCGKRRGKAGDAAHDINISIDFHKPFLEKWGLTRTKSYHKQIPSTVLKHRALARECLRGLFDTDGTVEPNGSVCFCTVSEHLARQVQLLLLTFGVVSRKRVRTTASQFGVAYHIGISGYDTRLFRDRIGFGLARKQTLLEQHAAKNHNTNRDVVPGVKEYAQREIKAKHRLSQELSTEWRDEIRRKNNQEHLSYTTVERYIEFFERCGIDDGELAPLRECVREHFFFSPITEIESLSHDCLDFNVPTGERYWTNGFISHNSFLVGIFALYWAIFTPNARIIIASFSFRQSRAILDLCVKFINESNAYLLKACFPNDMRRGTDECRLEVPNGAVIRCLPLGDGKKIRGVRADVLIIDEFAFLPESIIGEILRPFLASKNKIREQRAINEREDEMVARGEITEEQRTVLDDRKKVIFLSSASYQFEHLYKRYKDWIELLQPDPVAQKDRFDEFKESGRGYFVSRISWEAAPDGLLDMREIMEAKRELSESMFNREYGAHFTSDSDGYFRAAKMQACTVPDGEAPCLELIGDPNAEYVLGIDQSLSGSEGSDHFAMCLLKIVTRQTDGKKLGMLVHSYAVAGGNLKDHALYLYYLMTRFNVVYIGLDASQGDEVEFVNSCNQSRLFQDKNIQLLAIEADFKKDDYRGLPEQIKRSYNRAIGRIVQKQPFHSSFQRAANEYLQACFDHRNIRIGGKIAANDTAASNAMSTDISLLTAHEEFNDMSVSEFMLHQDFLADLTKKECAMIQIKTSDLGNMSFGLPTNLKKTTGASKVRKDSYSALLIANWSLKLYIESLAIQVQTGPRDFPYAMVG